MNKYNKAKVPTYILVQSAPQKANKQDLILTDYAVDKYSKKYNVDKGLIYAIIKHESGYRKNAVSSAGCIGLMQISPDKAIHPFDIEENVEAGTKYISYLINKYDGDISRALWAYNAGPTNVDNNRVPSSTKKYARRIIGDSK